MRGSSTQPSPSTTPENVAAVQATGYRTEALRGITEKLVISPATVQNHVASICAQLGIREDTKMNRPVCAVKVANKLGTCPARASHGSETAVGGLVLPVNLP